MSGFEMGAAAERRLAARRPLALDARAPVAIKRNLHEADIGADADAFARAFTATLSEPRAFGPIRIKRARGRVGQPFALGERFLGAVDLGLPAWLTERFTSDFAEIIELTPRRARYRYLDGCPMAGVSSFEITPAGDGRCRFSALFEYQELGGLGISVLSRFGLRLHDRVVAEQVAAAARSIGADILWTTFA